MVTTNLEQQLANHRVALVDKLQQVLRDGLFDARSTLRPSQLAILAQAEADAFIDFLWGANFNAIVERGDQLCETGLAVSTLLLIGQTLRQFCEIQLAGEARWRALETVEVYRNALLQGYLRAREARILREQEQLRSALQRQLVHYTDEHMRHYEIELAYRQELARAYQQLLRRDEQEQRQLARELHDGPVQQLLIVAHQLDRLRLARARQPHQASQIDDAAFTEVRQQVLEVVMRLRQFTAELRPAGLEELGLPSALRGYVAHLKQVGGAELPTIELDLPNETTGLPEAVSICLCRVVQEAMRNTVKHARAQHIQLSLHLTVTEAILRVRDDGCGFYPPAHLSSLAQFDHFGLVGIAERVQWVSGQFILNSQPGAGTELIVRIPLNSMG